MASPIIKKPSLIIVVIVAFCFLLNASISHAAIVPSLRGRVMNQITNTPIAGVWVKMQTTGGNPGLWTPCLRAAAARYQQTDSNGYFNFDGFLPYENVSQSICNDSRLGRMIDIDKNGTLDVEQIPRMTPTCYTSSTEPNYPNRRVCSHEFGCFAAPMTISVVTPVGWGGFFTSERESFNNAQSPTTITLGNIYYYPPTNTISGNVFIDYNTNGVKDSGEPNYTGASIRLSGASTRNIVSNINGNYQFADLSNGTYTTTITVPSGYINTTATTSTASITSNRTLNFGISPTYAVSGRVFIDANRNGIQDAGESNHTGTPAISTSRGTLIRNPDGSYNISNLSPGSLNVSFTNLPAGYNMTSPLNGPPPSYQVTVGRNCNTNGAAGANCQ